MFAFYKMWSSVGVKHLHICFLIYQFFSGKLIFLFNSSLESWRKKRKKNTCATVSGLQFPNETGLQNKHHNYMHLFCVCVFFCFLLTSWFSRRIGQSDVFGATSSGEVASGRSGGRQPLQSTPTMLPARPPIHTVKMFPFSICWHHRETTVQTVAAKGLLADAQQTSVMYFISQNLHSEMEKKNK